MGTSPLKKPKQPGNKYAEQIEQVKDTHSILTAYLNFASMHQTAGLERIIQTGKERKK